MKVMRTSSKEDHCCLWLPFAKHIILLILLFLVVLPLLCHNKPQSVYHTIFNNEASVLKSVNDENDKRIMYSHQLLDAINTERIRHTCNELQMNKPTVAMTVITTSRKNIVKNDAYSPRYLTQTVANFLHQIQELDDCPFRIHFSICNGDPNPEKHTEVDELSGFVPVHVQPVHKESLPVGEQHKRTYMYCLNKTQQYQPDFTLLVEDDAVPRSDALSVISWLTRDYFNYEGTIPDPSAPKDIRIAQTMYVKLYHPERLLGFLALDRERLPELFSFGLLFSTLALGSYYWMNAHDRRRIWEKAFSVWVVLFVVFTCACLCVGRTNLIEFHRFLSPHLYYITPTPSCCAQAIMYPKHSVQPLLDHLQDFKCTTGFDQALDAFISHPKRQGYLVQPNVFSHIGMYSVMRKRKINPFFVD